MFTEDSPRIKWHDRNPSSIQDLHLKTQHKSVQQIYRCKPFKGLNELYTEVCSAHRAADNSAPFQIWLF